MTEVWKGRLLPASFRGLPFFVDNHEFVGGRNNVSHEPVDKNTPHSEDVGRKTQGFTINGHVLGDNYFFQRDAIILAMENPDTGILIHPYLGPKEVRPGEFRIAEDNFEGRICRFTLEFVEAGDPSSPLGILDTVMDTLTKIVSLGAIAQNFLVLGHTLEGLPGFVRAASVSAVRDFKLAVETAANRSRTIGDEQAALFRDLDEMDANAETLVDFSASMAATFASIIDLVNETVDQLTDVNSFERSTIDITSGRDDKQDAFELLTEFEPTALALVPDLDTPSRNQERANLEFIRDLIQILALARWTETAVLRPFTSTQEAIETRDKILTAYELQLVKENLTDELFQSLKDLKASLVAAVPNPNLASIQEVVLSGGKNSLLIVYDLYQEPSRELDIIERNKIENPTAISGTIEALID